MNKKTKALTTEQYTEIIMTMRKGVCGCRPNERIATALVLEGNLGLRISDILKLKLSDIVKDGDRYRLCITEQKTGKQREFTVPLVIQQYIENYCLRNGIRRNELLFPISERAVQKQLSFVCDALGYEDPRLERQLYVITNFFKHTKGGGFFFTEVGEVHNVWLDVYDYAGMLPFLMFVFFTFSVIKHMLKCFKATSQDTVAAYLIVVLFSYMISFAEEPVIRASEPYFVLFFFVCGLVCTYKNSV